MGGGGYVGRRVEGGVFERDDDGFCVLWCGRVGGDCVGDCGVGVVRV